MESGDACFHINHIYTRLHRKWVHQVLIQREVHLARLPSLKNGCLVDLIVKLDNIIFSTTIHIV